MSLFKHVEKATLAAKINMRSRLLNFVEELLHLIELIKSCRKLKALVLKFVSRFGCLMMYISGSKSRYFKFRRWSK